MMEETEKSESVNKITSQIPSEYIYNQAITKKNVPNVPLEDRNTISSFLRYIRYTEIWAPLIYTGLTIFCFREAYHFWLVFHRWDTEVWIFIVMGLASFINGIVCHVSVKCKRLSKL